MKREFRDQYERELKLLYERSAEFSSEYPGIAERLGTISEEKMDPGIVALLEGTAFMAARVQLKLKDEFSQFTQTLLEQLLPNYLEPIPSVIMVQAEPDFENPDLIKGLQYDAGELLNANYIELERKVSCRFQLCSNLKIWPVKIDDAKYHASPAPLQALKIDTPKGTKAGLQISISMPSGKSKKAEPVSKLPIDELKFYLSGTYTEMDQIYEHIFAQTTRVLVRYLDSFGETKYKVLASESIEQIGFDETELLFPDDERIFPGFNLIREFFIFSEKFLGFKLTNFQSVLQDIDTDKFEIIIEFNTVRSNLKAAINKKFFQLHSSPAINLFEMNCSRIPVKDNQYEHHVVPDRSRWLEYEAHKVLSVQAHYGSSNQKVPAFPIYQLPLNGQKVDETIFYKDRRLPRRPTIKERRYGNLPSYIGTETYISFYEPATINSNERIRELQVRALCSNRHLAEQLPVGESGADFILATDTSIVLNCTAGPTKPRESIVYFEHKSGEAPNPGKIMWQLINLLNYNHLGLSDRNSKDPAAGLRDFLSLFADLSNVVTELNIQGITNLKSKPIVRRLRQPNGFNAARGIEITVTIDEKNFEGSGIMLLGAVLDRFFADHSSMNSFTETVIISAQRGVIKRWPPRSGTGRLI